MAFEVNVQIDDREVFNALNKASDVKFKGAFAAAIDYVDRRVTPRLPRDKGDLARSKRVKKRVSKASLSITAFTHDDVRTNLGQLLAVEYGNRRRPGRSVLGEAFDVQKLEEIIGRELGKEFDRIRGDIP